MLFFLCRGFSPLYRKKLSSSCNLPTNLLSYGFSPNDLSMGFRGLGWLGRTRLKCFLQVTVETSFPTGRCSTVKTLILSFIPIEIVPQRDLRWWTRRQNIAFSYNFSPVFNLSTLYNAICWKCPPEKIIAFDLV